MQRVPLDKVTPGMFLAKAVVNDKGMTLCAEGAEMTAAMIERLRRMDVSSVSVKGHPVDIGEDVKSKEQLVTDMQARFENVKGDPIMERIKISIGKVMMNAEEEVEETGDANG